MNSFVWGLDNRIYGGSAGIGGVVVAPVEAPGAAPVMLGHEDFSFDPRTLMIRTEAGSAHTGLSFDN